MKKINDKINPLVKAAIKRRDPEFMFYFLNGEYRAEKERRNDPRHVDYSDYSEICVDRESRRKTPLNEREDRNYHADYFKGSNDDPNEEYYDMDF